LTRRTAGCFFFFFLPALKIAFYEKLKQKPGMSKEKRRNITTFCTFLLARERYKYSYKETYPVPAGQNLTFDYVWNFHFCYKQAVYYFFLLLLF